MHKLVVIALFLQSILAANLDLPEYFPRCYKNDKRLENCLINATETLKEYLPTGFPEFKIPPLEPMNLDEFHFYQSSSEFQYEGGSSNLIITGLSNYSFESFKYDPRTLKIFGRVLCSPVLLEGKYNVSRKVVIVPVNGEMTISLLVGPTASNFTIEGTLVNINNEIYYHPTKVVVKMDIDDFRFKSIDFLGLNEMTGQLIMNILNNFSEFLIFRMTPVFEKLAEISLLDYVTRFTHEVPLNKILPSLHNKVSM